MHKICCVVSAHFHVIVTPPPTVWDNVTQTWVPDTTNATLIEQEIMDFMHAHHENQNKANFSNLVKSNLELFLEIIQTHPMVQAETDLYNCVLKRHEHII